MRILVVGGTGFIGTRVVARLAAHDVTVFHRGNECTDYTCEHIHGERGNLLSFREQFARHQFDVVLDMTARNGDDAALGVATFTGLAPRLVLISSGSVYRTFGVLLGVEDAAVDNDPCTEDAALRSRLFPYRGAVPRHPSDRWAFLDDYDKILAERCYLNATGLGSSVIRLPMVYGPGDPDRRLVPYVRRMLDDRPIPLQPRVASWRNSRGYVDNVAAAIARVVTVGRPSAIYNYAEQGDASESEWICRIGELLGWQRNFISVPDGAAFGGPSIDELPREARFEQHLRIDSRRLREQLDYNEVVSSMRALEYAVQAAQDDAPRIDYNAEEGALRRLALTLPR